MAGVMHCSLLRCNAVGRMIELTPEATEVVTSRSRGYEAFCDLLLVATQRPVGCHLRFPAIEAPGLPLEADAEVEVGEICPSNKRRAIGVNVGGGQRPVVGDDAVINEAVGGLRLGVARVQ